MGKYNPIKTVKGYCVIEGRNTVAENALFKWGVSEKNKKWNAREWMEVMCIFKSKRKALEYISYWKNSDDFMVVPIKFEIPEAN